MKLNNEKLCSKFCFVCNSVGKSLAIKINYNLWSKHINPTKLFLSARNKKRNGLSQKEINHSLIPIALNVIHREPVKGMLICKLINEHNID